MSRFINLADHKNLWGTTTESGLEPQRSDLWLVDMTQVVNGLNGPPNIFQQLKLAAVPTFFTQLVQSVTLPELKMKPEVIRRDSVPFNMPSWDDPPDAVKIVFLLDTGLDPNESLVISLLTAWQAVVRAGRGDRTNLYSPDTLNIVLNASYRYDYTFPVRVAQLRGGSSEAGALSNNQISQLNQNMVNQSSFASSQQNSLQGLTGAVPTFNQVVAPTAGPVRSITELGRPLTQQPWLQVSNEWVLSNAWLGGWKVTDLSYGDSKLTTVDATLYVEDFFQTNA